MPSTPFSSSSRISVISVSTTSGLAPGNTVETDTIGKSTFGSSRTGSRIHPVMPSTTSASESTLAKTGRSIEMRGRSTSVLLGGGAFGRWRGVAHRRALLLLDDGAVGEAVLAARHDGFAGLEARSHFDH